MLLIGGADKDLPWETALVFALRKARHIIIFGEDGEKQVATKVMKLLAKMRVGDEQTSRARTLEAAVERAGRGGASGRCGAAFAGRHELRRLCGFR